MIASQSFLLAVGVILLEKSTILLSVCVIVALFQLWFIWYRIIRVRTIIVDYYKHGLSQKFSDMGTKKGVGDVGLREDTYVKKAAIRKVVNDQLADDERKPKLKHNFRLTRVKLDVLLPITFSIIWIGLLVANFITLM